MTSIISSRLQKFESSGIREVFDQAKYLINPINLSIGQPHFDTPVVLKEEIIKAVQCNKNQYTVTQGNSDLIEILKKQIEKESQFIPESLMITSGVSGGIYLSLNVFIEQGDEVIIFDPYFVMYKELIKFIGGKPVVINTYPDFTIQEERLSKAITSKTKLIIINSPGNPSGHIYSKEELDIVIKIAKKNSLYILFDEIYKNFNYTKEEFSAPYQEYDKVITLNGFSKSHGVTGWRVGYAYGNKMIINEMIKLQQFTYVCAPSIVQKAMLKAFEKNVIEEINQKVLEYKKKAESVYQELSPFYQFSTAKGAFYNFIKSPYETNEFINDALKENLLILPGKIFSEENSHFRLSFAAEDEVLLKGCKILKKLATKN